MKTKMAYLRRSLPALLLLFCSKLCFATQEIACFQTETLDKNEKRVLEAVKNGFVDIFESKTHATQDAYLEMDMGLNETISLGKCYVAIYFKREKGRTQISAYPFACNGNERVSVYDPSIMRGVKLLIEGVVKELNYPYEMSNHRYAGFNEFENLEEVAGGPLQIRSMESIYKR